ncbi:hypothetical protein COR50_05255 [Chitinophaga caeni]|uniref:Uncharacterized protein n=1 Tax=Chitinophaga caeni TaxID=2029983 RepID=A0A291QRR9_9BACT|nr:hypothetical protein COR50_05255 [Chitinophaga caeni]
MEYRLRMICSTYRVAPARKQECSALLIANESLVIQVAQKLHRAIKLAAVKANLCSFLVLFWASKKEQETGRWALSRAFNGDRCSSTLKI